MDSKSYTTLKNQRHQPPFTATVTRNKKSKTKWIPRRPSPRWDPPRTHRRCCRSQKTISSFCTCRSFLSRRQHQQQQRHHEKSECWAGSWRRRWAAWPFPAAGAPPGWEQGKPCRDLSLSWRRWDEDKGEIAGINSMKKLVVIHQPTESTLILMSCVAAFN